MKASLWWLKSQFINCDLFLPFYWQVAEIYLLKTRFLWLATESASKDDPMRIMDGTFYYHNEKGGLYVPAVASVNPGWGTGRSTHIEGEDFKALPDRLDIRFFRLLKINYIKIVLIFCMKKF